MRLEVKIFLFSYFVLVLVMFVLPFFTAAGYSILKHTTSQLGAQKTPNAWIMNFTFILMGLSSIYAGWLHYDKYWFQKVFLLIFGCSFALTAIFSHAPIDSSLSYNVKDDQLHSFFASSTGFGFTVLAISTGFVKEVKGEMVLPIAVGIIAVTLSMLMFMMKDYTGLLQRLLMLTSLGWMLFEFNRNLN